MYYLIAPYVRERTKYFLIISIKTIIGNTESVAVANIGPHNISVWVIKRLVDTGSVTASLSVRKNAKTYSFQNVINTRIAVAARPGVMSGRVIIYGIRS